MTKCLIINIGSILHLCQYRMYLFVMYKTIHEYRAIQGLKWNMQNRNYSKHINKLGLGFFYKRKERGGGGGWKPEPPPPFGHNGYVPMSALVSPQCAVGAAQSGRCLGRLLIQFLFSCILALPVHRLRRLPSTTGHYGLEE